MPPKRKVDDPKLRKLTEFWVIPLSTAASSQPTSSSPNRISSSYRSRSSSPSKHARASPSKPTMAQSRLARAGNLQLELPRTPSKKPQQTTLPFMTNRTPTASSSKSKPSASPKFIVIDDESEEISSGSPLPRHPTQTMSRKRPRDTNANTSSLPPCPFNAREVVDLTLTPPPKRRALFKQADAALPTPSRSSIPSHQYRIPVSSREDVVSYAVPASANTLGRIASPCKVAAVTASSQPTFYSGTRISRSPGVATLPTPEASSPVLRLDFRTAPLTSSMTVEERTKAKIEELRQKAKVKAQAAEAAERRTIHYVPDDSDDDDLIFDFGPLNTSTSKTEKKTPVVPPEAEPSMTTQKRAGQSLNALSPLTDPGFDSSEDETAWASTSRPAIRVATGKAAPGAAVSKIQSMRNSALTSSSASTSESLSAPKAKLAGRPEQKRGSDLLDLESVLNGIITSHPKTSKEFTEMVKHDLAKLERGQLGGVVSSEPSDDEVEGEVVDETVHERVLGAKQAEKVSRMLKSDRSRNIMVIPWRPFWTPSNGSSGETMGTNFTIPPLIVQSDVHSILKELKQLVHDNDTRRLSFILTSGVLLALPNEFARENLTTWLFLLATAVGTPPELAHAAVNAFTNLYPPRAPQTNSNRAQVNSVPECYLSVGDMIQVVSDLGPERDVFNNVFGVSQEVSPPHPCSRELREKVLFRLLRMLRAISCAGGFLPFIDAAVLVFALIGLDNSTTDALRRDIRITIEYMIASLDSAPESTGYTVELSTCNSLLGVGLGFRSIEKEKLLSLIVGGCVRSRRVVRWTAFGLLLSRSSLSLSEELFLKPPPLEEVAALLDQSNEEDVPFRVRKNTNYAELVTWTAVLGICLNDVIVYHRSQPTLLEAVITHLDQMHSAIQDGKAAFLDRTRAKDMIQRLKMRLIYQRPGASKARLTDHFSTQDSA